MQKIRPVKQYLIFHRFGLVTSEHYNADEAHERWRCDRCGERHGQQYDACWNCGAMRSPDGVNPVASQTVKGNSERIDTTTTAKNGNLNENQLTGDENPGSFRAGIGISVLAATLIGLAGGAFEALYLAPHSFVTFTMGPNIAFLLLNGHLIAVETKPQTKRGLKRGVLAVFLTAVVSFCTFFVVRSLTGLPPL